MIMDNSRKDNLTMAGIIIGGAILSIVAFLISLKMHILFIQWAVKQ